MHEVFENIIDKLELNSFEMGKDIIPIHYVRLNKAIEIVKKEEEKYNNGHFGCNTNGEHEKCNGCGLTDCKNRNKIWFGVSDDNNGWIPCSERLPEDDSICIVTVEYPNNKTMVDYGWFDRKSCCWFVGMQEFRTSNILAWQPLPKPYQPKGE